MSISYLTIPLKRSKMKAFKFFVGALLILSPHFTNAASVSFGVTFGNPQSNGGACVGKGVCKQDGVGVDGSEVTVAFVTCDGNPNVLVLRFSLSELSSKQPEKVADFTNPAGYSFDALYALNNPGFQPLNLPPSARVMPGVQYTVQINGDQVSVYIPYSFDPSQPVPSGGN